MYSQKVTGKIIGRSINSLDPVERFIAPSNFIDKMSKGMNIKFNSSLTKEILCQQKENPKEDIISTIPMPIMMNMVDWKFKPEFKWSKIWSVWGKIESPSVEVYQTIYFPGPNRKYYRVSITGDTYIAEYIGEVSLEDAQRDFSEILKSEFGIDVKQIPELKIKMQEYGKLLPIDDQSRKEFILYMTDKYRIYSLGRFATWRQLLLDDIIDDAKKIENWIEFRDDYKRKMELY